MAIERDHVFQPTPVEKEILHDIKQKTGLTFRLLGGIDTRDKQIADAVLPALIPWVERLPDNPPHRGGIYLCFAPQAAAYIDDIIRWWTEETDYINLTTLTHILGKMVRPEHAERVWKLTKELPRRPMHYFLLSKLAAFPAVAPEVKAELIRALDTEELTVGDLDDISKVADPQIQAWFEARSESPDKNIRKIAKRVLARGKGLPKGVVYATSEPDRQRALLDRNRPRRSETPDPEPGKGPGF